MWVKQCHKPAMTGNGFYIPPIKMVMTGGWFIIVLPTLQVLGAVMGQKDSKPTTHLTHQVGMNIQPHEQCPVDRCDDYIVKLTRSGFSVSFLLPSGHLCKVTIENIANSTSSVDVHISQA